MSTNVSTNFVPQTNGQWKPRKTETIATPGGVEVQVRRPGPEFMLRAGRAAQTFSRTAAKEKPKDQTEQEYGLDVLAKMSDEELAGVLVFARELVCAMLVSPKLVKNPRPNTNEIGPDDIGDADFWFLFDYAMKGYYGLKVPVGNEEVEVSDLESFRSESSVSGSGVDSESLSPDTEQPIGS